MWKLNNLTPNCTSLAQNVYTKRWAVTIYPPVQHVGEPKKKKERKEGRKKERHPKQWQTGYSPRPPTLTDQNQTLHGGWPSVCSYRCQVWSKSVKGLRRCRGSNMVLPEYFGQWLIQQLVLKQKHSHSVFLLSVVNIQHISFQNFYLQQLCVLLIMIKRMLHKVKPMTTVSIITVAITLS